MKKKNPLVEKSYELAIEIIKISRFLIEEKREYVLSKQVLKSGTSIGANIQESQGAQSKKDFISKLSIAYKEAKETVYWIRLLRDTNFLSIEIATSVLMRCEEMLKMIGSIQITMKKQL